MVGLFCCPKQCFTRTDNRTFLAQFRFLILSPVTIHLNGNDWLFDSGGMSRPDKSDHKAVPCSRLLGRSRLEHPPESTLSHFPAARSDFLIRPVAFLIRLPTNPYTLPEIRTVLLPVSARNYRKLSHLAAKSHQNCTKNRIFWGVEKVAGVRIVLFYLLSGLVCLCGIPISFPVSSVAARVALSIDEHVWGYNPTQSRFALSFSPSARVFRVVHWLVQYEAFSWRPVRQQRLVCANHHGQ